jgi:hypothetical protein
VGESDHARAWHHFIDPISRGSIHLNSPRFLIEFTPFPSIPTSSDQPNPTVSYLFHPNSSLLTLNPSTFTRLSLTQNSLLPPPSDVSRLS